MEVPDSILNGVLRLSPFSPSSGNTPSENAAIILTPGAVISG